MSLRICTEPRRGRMNNIVWILIAATLAIGSGCARPDWIESTLVTVDLTGVWQGTFTREGAYGPGTSHSRFSKADPR